MLNFEINLTPGLSGESFIAVILAALIFVAVPLLLAIIEYRMTKKNKKHGLYLMVGVFISSVIFGAFSLFVGILLAAIYIIATHSLSKA